VSTIFIIDSIATLSAFVALLFLVTGFKGQKLSQIAHCIIFSLLLLTLTHDIGNVFEYGNFTKFFDKFIESPIKIVLSAVWLVFLLVSLRDVEIAEHIKTRKALSNSITMLKQMVELSKELSSTTNPRLLYRKIVLSAIELLRLDFSTIMLLSEDGKQLIIKDTIGFSENMIDSYSLTIGEGLSTYSLKNKRTETVTDYQSEKRFKIPSVIFKENIMSAISSPMMIEDEVLGVLIGHTIQRRVFTEEEKEVFQGLANEAALAVKNAKQLEELNRERLHLKALLDAIPDLILRISADGIVLSYKPALNIPTSFSPREPVGKKLQEVFNEDISNLTLNTISNAVNTGHMVHFNYKLPFPDKERFFEARIVPVSKDEVVAMIRDFTDWVETQSKLKRYQSELETLVEERTRELKERIGEIELLNRGMMNLLEDLQEANKKLEITTRRLKESNEELEAFAYSVSHDLRAPLRAMQGFSEALLEDYSEKLDELGREYAKRIRDAAKRMDNLIVDLLSYSRLTRSEIRLQPVNLEGVINEAISQLKSFIEEKGAKVSVSDNLPVVRATHSIALQIFSNLISNAVKFSRPDISPEVKIYTQETENNRVRVIVQDNGIGIEPEHFERIFKIFERLHGIETYPGTGIGLAIVKKGAEKIGAKAGIESSPGKGSRFWVEFIKWENEGAAYEHKETHSIS